MQDMKIADHRGVGLQVGLVYHLPASQRAFGVIRIEAAVRRVDRISIGAYLCWNAHEAAWIACARCSLNLQQMGLVLRPVWREIGRRHD
ncbi:hypothetical protein CSC76_07770 [Pseudoxanthomonas mexicana]|nr:hypothetical protein CSC76_07770 [Pseudoxanthomonas mexicana]